MLMTIELPHLEGEAHWIADRERVSQCTSVKFLDHERLVACNLVGHCMYLIRFDIKTKEWQIEQTLPTQFEGETVITDLIDIRNQCIVTSNCHHASLTLYRFEEDKIVHWKDLPIEDKYKGYVHGVKFSPFNPNILWATCITNGRLIFIIDFLSVKVLAKFREDRVSDELTQHLGPWRPKDLCFPKDNQVVVVSEAALDDNKRYEGQISLMELDLVTGTSQYLDRVVLKEGIQIVFSTWTTAYF